MDIKTTSDFRPRQKTSVSMKSGANQTSQKTLSKSGPNVDTFESSAPKIFGDKMLPGSAEGLIFEGPIPSSGTLLGTSRKRIFQQKVRDLGQCRFSDEQRGSHDFYVCCSETQAGTEL